MDEAGRFTAEHTVMESGIEIRKLKHLLEVAEDKIKELEKENAELKKMLAESMLEIRVLKEVNAKKW